MISKLNALGLAVLAMAAMSAFAASAAQAGEFDIGVQPASLFAVNEAGQIHQLQITSTAGGKFNTNCPNASLEGTTQGQKINEATATATYGPNCTAFGVAAQVVMNGCKYTITGTTHIIQGQQTIHVVHPANTAVVDVVGCTQGKSIEIKTAICTLDIPQQNELSHIIGSNVNAQQVTLAATVSGITVRQTGAACPDGNNHVSTTGAFVGNTLGVGRSDVGGSQVTKHSHQYQELSQAGAQTTIAST